MIFKAPYLLIHAFFWGNFNRTKLECLMRSSIWALSHKNWLLDEEVMGVQSWAFEHVFPWLREISNFLMVASFASNLIFLDFWWSKSKSNFIFMILGLKSPCLSKNFKKSKFDCIVDFLSDESETSIFKRNLWSWCNSHLIGIPWGYKYDNNENFLIWPKNSSFVLVHQMKFHQGKP